MLSADLTFETQDKSQLQFLASERENQEEYKVRKVQAAVQALLLCHNVTPVLDNSVRSLQGSSPDELTLVSFAESLGFCIRERS
jgi:magnesium-transporting ATPase (P-type)